MTVPTHMHQLKIDEKLIKLTNQTKFAIRYRGIPIFIFENKLLTKLCKLFIYININVFFNLKFILAKSFDIYIIFKIGSLPGLMASCFCVNTSHNLLSSAGILLVELSIVVSQFTFDYN